MTFQDLISKAQQGFQNIGFNLQGGGLPSPFAPKQDPMEARRVELLNQRANLAKQSRNLKEQIAYNTDPVRIRDEATANGWMPITEANTVRIGGGNPNTPVPSPTASAPSPTPSPQERILDVGAYQGISPTEVPLPSQDIQNLLWETFPNEATQSAVALAGENARFDPNATNVNSDGTTDYGLFQNNSKTLDDLLKKQRYAVELRAAGINKPEDVLGDPKKSAIASAITRKYETDAGASPWSWWYGWQNKGYNIAPERGTTEEVANLEYDSGRKPYFQLHGRVNNWE